MRYKRMCGSIRVAVLGSPGCGDDSTPGPHSTQCLQLFWRMVGCSMHGTMAPAEGNSQWQDSRTVGQLKQDMREHHDQAIAGGDDNSYVAGCFGMLMQLKLRQKQVDRLCITDWGVDSTSHCSLNHGWCGVGITSGKGWETLPCKQWCYSQQHLSLGI